MDASGNFKSVNEQGAKILGHEESDLIGQNFLQFVHPDDVQMAIDTFQGDVSSDAPRAVDLEIRAICGDGSTRWFSVNSSVTLDESGAFLQEQGVARDITEKKRAEEERVRLEAQLRHTQKLESLGVLAGGIAHDFNNLLTGVLGNADLALLELPPESSARTYLRRLRSAAHHLAGLTNQLLAYSGKGRFIVTALNLSRLIEELSHLLDVSRSKKVALEYDLSHELPSIDADPSQVRQIVMNLVANASEAIGERGGLVTVRTGEVAVDGAYLNDLLVPGQLAVGRYVFLEVSDNGCGMDTETTRKMFDPFFTTKFSGRGLGLAAIQGIVRGHRGAIKVESRQGRGSTISVLFPISAKKVQSTAEPLIGEPQPTEGVVLIVDDEETVRNVAEGALTHGGFSVLSASDGNEALELLKTHATKVVAILLDLVMPNLDGEATFAEISRHSAEIPVILCSGYSENDATQRFAGKGLAGFLQKPFDVESLVHIIADVARSLD